MSAPTNRFFETIRAALLGEPSLTSMVSGRVARGLARQGEALPLVAVHMLGDEHESSHDAPEQDTERRVRVQFDCDALNPASASEVAEAVDAGVRGSLAMTGQPVAVTGVAYEDAYTQFFQTPAATNQNAEAFHRESRIYLITYRT